MTPTPCPHADALRVGPRPRCYACLKAAALNGGRAKLSLEQLQFVGFDLAPPPQRGWRPAWTILPALDGTEDGDPEATRGIRYLMKREGQDRLELTT
jgi:hypothetical protein